MNCPNVFLVGAPKCGTTSLTQYLHHHPDVFVCRPRETSHFCTDMDIHPSLRIADRKKYLRLFANAGNASAKLDGSVWHLYSKEAAANIHDFAPDAKILIMLRQPVDMMWSLHGWYLYAAADDIVDFGEALAAQEDRRAGRRIPSDTVSAQTLQYTDVVTFSTQVQRYLDRFDRKQVKIVLFDDFVRDTPGVYAEILTFFDVDSTIPADFNVHGAAQEIRNPGIKQFLRRNKWLRQSIARTIPSEMRGRIGHFLASIGPVPEQRSKTMDPELRQQLMEQFKPEIETLSTLIDRDLSHWLRPRTASGGAQIGRGV